MVSHAIFSAYCKNVAVSFFNNLNYMTSKSKDINYINCLFKTPNWLIYARPHQCNQILISTVVSVSGNFINKILS